MPDIFVKDDTIHATNNQPLTFFSAFCKDPLGVRFQSQEDNEKVILFVRKHFITNISWILTGAIFFFLPPVIQIFKAYILLPFYLPNQYVFLLILFYYGLVFSYLFSQFITWYYTVSLVTNKRIVDVDFFYLLYHDVAITKLDLVEDVHYKKTGFFSSFYNYGDVYVQTAAERGLFDFLQIPKPEIAVEIIGDLIGKQNHA
ncbi:MAG: hypothetical protein A3F31_01760 [Candidatus Levybacteria bacterium RIFCSPHIGHO2_12_FULL_38_12]|nr:MAG: hypothetical protein A2770_03220 [Candidatus Levybacteria bacterium RIFCSPHIGHO2_01_FULL_38_12]OGH22203.1 MAG: hypothetical protein A3F31_01760 [Candidatus Levybacteria bacterium RIFCSPHIGHO2_12_FULL_38_12]OGH34367.1 MAG: hypothetical protein A3A47_02120 [Candidatus Levybacteria bacterium RIFCSPLOWO2_01_FULL_37_20]OGH44249.1 MAG: hypothetical protein A3J14_01705 [Candidatus Levybacteria bacterium RIFCSPLOWO2_02_FULL_37_18]OGH51695.1 MAG: hypothetical protein A3G13_00590 [Candidatus Levy